MLRFRLDHLRMVSFSNAPDPSAQPDVWVRVSGAKMIPRVTDMAADDVRSQISEHRAQACRRFKWSACF